MGDHGKWPFVWAGAAMLAAGMLVWLVYQAQTRKRRMQRLLHATLTKRRRL